MFSPDRLPHPHDDCDYGIGGYCYQLVDNTEQTVALSRANRSMTHTV
jgi:hypothetical protein